MKQVTPEQADELNRGKLADHLGIKVVEFTPGLVKATMPVVEATRQPMGVLHGGASLALAETIASIGAWYSVADRGKVVVGMEINANHLRTVREGLVTGVGQPLHQGNTSQVWEVKIYDEAERLVCVSRCTLAVIEPR
ncbi:MAG: hotdog fold thioesterase [bacterium]